MVHFFTPEEYTPTHYIRICLTGISREPLPPQPSPGQISWAEWVQHRLFVRLANLDIVVFQLLQAFSVKLSIWLLHCFVPVYHGRKLWKEYQLGLGGWSNVRIPDTISGTGGRTCTMRTTALPFLRKVVAQLRAVLWTCQAPLADSCSLEGIGVIGIFCSAVIDGKIVFERVGEPLDSVGGSIPPWILPHFRHDGNRPFQAKGKTQQL